jgi:hypothetical protein
MQDRTRSFLDIRSIFQSSKRPRSPNRPKAYHYKKREPSRSSQKLSTMADEHTIYILERSLSDPQLSGEPSIFRKLSVRDPPSCSRSRQTSSRSSRRSSGSSGVHESDTLSSADSGVPLSRAQFPSPSRRSASPQTPRRRGGGSTFQPYTHSGLSVRPFSSPTAPQSQSLQGLQSLPPPPNMGETSYCRPTPFAYPYLNSSRSYYQNSSSPSLAPAPARAPPVAGSIGPPLSRYSRHEPAGPPRPAIQHGYRDRMLVHASVHRNWGSN